MSGLSGSWWTYILWTVASAVMFLMGYAFIRHTEKSLDFMYGKHWHGNIEGGMFWVVRLFGVFVLLFSLVFFYVGIIKPLLKP